MVKEENHWCHNTNNFPISNFFQKGKNLGEKILIVGESPAENGWRKSGKACYSPEGKLLATGKRLNELLNKFNLSVDQCGFTELSKCFIGSNRKILDKCAKKCWPIFEKQLLFNKGNILIITLGVTTAKVFSDITGTKIIMGKFSKIYISEKNRFVLPIYHPSPANPYGRIKNQQIFQKHFLKIKEIIYE